MTPPQEILTRAVELLESGKNIRNGVWSFIDIDFLNKHLLLTAKPAIYLVNLSEKDFVRKKNKWYRHTQTFCIYLKLKILFVLFVLYLFFMYYRFFLFYVFIYVPLIYVEDVYFYFVGGIYANIH